VYGSRHSTRRGHYKLIPCKDLAASGVWSDTSLRYAVGTAMTSGNVSSSG